MTTYDLQNRLRQYNGPKTSVSRSEYDRLAAQFEREVAAERGRNAFTGRSLIPGRLAKDANGALYWELPNPMDQYTVKFEPTVTRNIVEQQTPANPGIREVTVSTLGVTIPVSMGRRVVTGNIIDAEPIAPRLEGAYEYTITERIPNYGGQGPS